MAKNLTRGFIRPVFFFFSLSIIREGFPSDDTFTLLHLLRTIPPEQQAEAAKLEAALSELQANTTRLYKDVVGGARTVFRIAFSMFSVKVK